MKRSVNADPQPAHGHLAAPIGARQREHAIEVLLDFRRRIAAAEFSATDRLERSASSCSSRSRPAGSRSTSDSACVRQRIASSLADTRVGDRGRAFEKRDRTRRLTAAIEVHGNRRAHVVEAIGEQQLHRPARCADGSAAGAPVRLPL